MSRFLGVLSVLAVLLLAMGFASANAGHRATIDLGLFTLYQVPVTLVAFSGLFVGMVVMFITGIHADLKVRRILRDRFAQDSLLERTTIDKNQQDLFGGAPGADDVPEGDEFPVSEIGPEGAEFLGSEIGPEGEKLLGDGAGPGPEESGSSGDVSDPGGALNATETETPTLQEERPPDPSKIE